MTDTRRKLYDGFQAGSSRRARRVGGAWTHYVVVVVVDSSIWLFSGAAPVLALPCFGPSYPACRVCLERGTTGLMASVEKNSQEYDSRKA